jgi:acyl-CoA synthetase (AMP-forming)/AMP-acid ligase II
LPTENDVTHWFLEKIASWGDRPAFVFGERTISHTAFAGLVRQWSGRLDEEKITCGDVVVVHGDYSPASCALIFALAARRAVVTPLTPLPRETLEQRCATAGADWVVEVSPDGSPRFERLFPAIVPDLIMKLRGAGAAGLILFSSGSSGEPKACLLNLDRLLETARKERKGYVTLVFLLFDHIGGINTMINVLGHGGTAVVVADRSVDTVAAAIESSGAELLPTSPTFLKMLLISDAASRFDLSSLKLITYGTEVMPKATLEGLHGAFPGVALKQTYGLSEIGIVPTRSRAPDSLWMQIGGANVEHKIVDGILWVRAATAMLGYLNAPSPFDAEGWLNTRDKVEVEGDYIRIIGRESELINVGGEKVHPAEVENILLRAPNIRDATVAARANPVMGSVVVATVSLIEPEDSGVLRHRLDKFCRERLEPYKVPAMFKITEGPLHSPRFKKIRAHPA